MVSLDEAQHGVTFEMTENNEEEEDNFEMQLDTESPPPPKEPPPPISVHTFHQNPVSGQVHTCFLFVFKTTDANMFRVPLQPKRLEDVRLTFGNMTLSNDPVHEPRTGINVFLARCTGATVMNAWTSRDGRELIAQHLEPSHVLDFIVTVPSSATTAEAWTGYKARVNGQNDDGGVRENVESLSSPGKYVVN